MTAIAEAPPSDLAPRISSNDPADFGMPNGREEEWRYTPLDQVRDFFDVQDWAPLEGVSVSPLVSRGPVSDDSWCAVDRPSAIARAGARDAVMVEIPPGHVDDQPIVVDLRGHGSGAYGFVVIDSGRESTATVVIRHDMSLDTSGVIVARTGDGSRLTVLSVMDGKSPTRHMWRWHSVVGRDATYQGLSVSMGSALVRVCPGVEYAGPGGSAELIGAFLTQGSEYQEHRVFIDHNQPHCSSNVVYKGALSGEASHSVWVGDVLVRRAAVGIETYELNRNLLLNDGPRADSVPNLELETGDVVGAGHASATGRFDDEQLFYLESRGIPEEVARQLVVRGFFVEVLSRIADDDLRREILSNIENRIGMSAS